MIPAQQLFAKPQSGVKLEDGFVQLSFCVIQNCQIVQDGSVIRPTALFLFYQFQRSPVLVTSFGVIPHVPVQESQIVPKPSLSLRVERVPTSSKGALVSGF